MAAEAAEIAWAQPGELLLIQFARTPREGHVKTRLIPHLGATGACELHCELTLWTCRQLLASKLGPVELAIDVDAGHPLFERCLAEGVTRISVQHGADLGARMHDALQQGLSRFRGVILVGSDCPGIDTTYLMQAADALRDVAVVLGPATDGGYVLIGARRVSESLFSGIPWGGDQVYAKTLEALENASLDWVALPPLTDIDRASDLPVWEALKHRDSVPASDLPRKYSSDTFPGNCVGD